MRKKLSLFLVMLMALTMELGTGITTMAAERPADAPLSVRQCTDSTDTSALYYVTGIEGDKVKIALYHHDDGSYWTGSGEQERPPIYFGDPILVGRVYHSFAGKYYFCNDNLPLDPVVIAECGNNEHQYFSHFYSYGTLNPEGDEVLGAYYYKSGNVCGHDDDASLLKSLFDGDYGEGWYYGYSAEIGGRATWYRCSGPHGITPVNPYNSNPNPDPDPAPTPEPDPDPTPEPKKSSSHKHKSEAPAQVSKKPVNTVVQYAETGIVINNYVANNATGVEPLPFNTGDSEKTGWQIIDESLDEHVASFANKPIETYSITMNGAATVDTKVITDAHDKKIPLSFVLDNGVSVGVPVANNVIPKLAKAGKVPFFKVSSMTTADVSKSNRKNAGLNPSDIAAVGGNENTPVVFIQCSNDVLSTKKSYLLMLTFDATKAGFNANDNVYLYCGNEADGIAMYRIGKVDENGLATFFVPMTDNYWTIGNKNMKNKLYHKVPSGVR